VTAIAFLGECRSDLGESPLWDERRGWLWWVDIRHARLCAADAAGRMQRDIAFDVPVCSIGLADNGLVAALGDGFALIGDEGEVRRLARPGIGSGAIRFNDGKADRQGRFLAGTMQFGGQEDPLATVWRLDRDGCSVQVADGMKLVNATCFSPDGRWLYLADSLEGVIRRYPYDPATGALGATEPFFDCTRIASNPDGATVDTEGRLWVALVSSQQIGCIAPDGKLLRLIDLPIPYPSCPAFGGVDRRTLFVTSIADSGHRLKSDHPEAGRLLVLSGLDAQGIAETPFALDHHNRD